MDLLSYQYRIYRSGCHQRKTEAIMNFPIQAPDDHQANPRAKQFRSRRVERIEHALFAVVLVTVGYVYLGALLAEAL